MTRAANFRSGVKSVRVPVPVAQVARFVPFDPVL
jgi:hypothetical protein